MPEKSVREMNAQPEKTPEERRKAVDQAVRHFVGGAPQFDDLTMLCLHSIGKPKGGNTPVKQLTIEASVESIEAVTDFINAELEALDCPMRAQMQLDVAIDEVFSNIARYAYAPGSGEATVCFETEAEPRAVVITFIDGGTPYDPLAAEDPDTSLPAEEREAGGLGVFLVKKTMDDVRYEHRDGKNILRIKKRI